MYIVHKSCIVPSLVTLLPKILKKVITQLELGLAFTCISVENTKERLHEQTLRAYSFIFVTHMATNLFHNFKPQKWQLYNCILLVQRKIHLHVGVKNGSKYWSNYQQSRKKTSIELKRAPVNIWATVKMSTDLCPQAVELRSPAFWRGSWSRPGWAWSPSGPRWSVCPLTAPGSWGPAETPLHHPSPIWLIHGSIIYTM